jgi:seryl-tRNA synthetase
MIDLKKLRENPGFFRKATADKQRDSVLVDKAINIDKEKREILQKVEALRAERNKLGKEGIERGKQIKSELENLEKQLGENDIKLNDALWQIPNPALSDVPIGRDESGNIEVRKWGRIPKLDFQAKAHYELGDLLDVVDTERAGKVSGTRFSYLKNEAVLLEMALLNFGFKTLVNKGFSPIFPPVLIQKKIMAALGYNNYSWEETYILDKDDLCLVATAEHAIVPYFKDEILEEGNLPKRFVGFSNAFRREAGSYGKDTKGIFRVHQFNKLEMVSFCRSEYSVKEHEFILSVEEELMQALELPYRVVQMCTGDLGDPAAAKFDVEVWFPSEGKYRETHSCSNCTDYQARRLNIKYKSYAGSSFPGEAVPGEAVPGEAMPGKGPETRYVHILNGTVFSERPILAILENYQQEDGSVLVPKVLQKYTGFAKISPKR